MKELLIMRHAKTESSEFFRSDFARNLTTNGVAQSQLQGKYLSLLPFEPDKVLVSSSNRTRQTLTELLPYTEWKDVDIETIDKLYHSSLQDLLEVIEEVGEEVDRLMIVSHNFGVLELVQHLSSDFIPKFKTGTLALFKLNTDNWQDINRQLAERVYIKEPLDE